MTNGGKRHSDHAAAVISGTDISLKGSGIWSLLLDQFGENGDKKNQEQDVAGNEMGPAGAGLFRFKLHLQLRLQKRWNHCLAGISR